MKVHVNLLLQLKCSWDTNPDLMEQQRDLIYNSTDRKERFAGQEWDLVNDTLLPIKYLAPGAKVKGKVLEEFTKDIIKDIPVTRRLVSRVLSQLYDSRGMFLSPLVMGLNIFLSRSCEMATSAELDLLLSSYTWWGVSKEIKGKRM